MDIEETYDKLLRYCYMKTHDQYVVVDIVQDTFVRFYETHSYKEMGKQLAFLYTIARNLCNDLYRKKKHESLDHIIEEVSGEDETNGIIRKLALEQAMEQLPEESRELLFLRYTNELSMGEITEIIRYIHNHHSLYE